MVWSAICNCGISQLYSLLHDTTNIKHKLSQMCRATINNTQTTTKPLINVDSLTQLILHLVLVFQCQHFFFNLINLFLKRSRSSKIMQVLGECMSKYKENINSSDMSFYKQNICNINVVSFQVICNHNCKIYFRLPSSCGGYLP